MQCPRCQQDNPSHAKFCLGCGAAVDGAVVAAGSHADLRAEVARLKGEIEGLRRSLGKALEQQTATSEILRVISQSPTDVQPVMKAIVESAVHLADADNALIGRAEGDHIRWLAVAGTLPELPHVSGQPISRSLPSGRAIIDGQTTQVEDSPSTGTNFRGWPRPIASWEFAPS
jgi:DNA-binding FrmR family transcriptional regulator